ncbi:MAG TPA: substrate-binding domain-containing protein [Xanthobacteraceae bacterium]|nr:substrate-binding domain-containing protein [Xanthobacteraceae bacterium]
MSEVKVLATTAMKTVFEELAPQFARATGNHVVIELGPSLRLEKELAEGKPADVAIVSRNGMADLEVRGRIAAGSAVHIADSTIGVAVAKGAPKPDISTPESFKRAMLAAKSIACSKPVGGGQSGVHLAKVFEQLGITGEMQTKSKYGAGGAAGLAGLVVLRGEAEIGIQQMAELMAVAGIDVVGPLPRELQSVTPFVAGVTADASAPDAARALIQFLATPAAKRVIAAKGLEPA